MHQIDLPVDCHVWGVMLESYRSVNSHQLSQWEALGTTHF